MEKHMAIGFLDNCMRIKATSRNSSGLTLYKDLGSQPIATPPCQKLVLLDYIIAPYNVSENSMLDSTALQWQGTLISKTNCTIQEQLL